MRCTVFITMQTNSMALICWAVFEKWLIYTKSDDFNPEILFPMFRVNTKC
jgi:hypothetical protein